LISSAFLPAAFATQFGETVVAFAQGFGRSEVVTVLQALQGDGLGSHTQEGT